MRGVVLTMRISVTTAGMCSLESRLLYPSLRLVWSVPVRKEANKIPDTKSLKRRFNVWYDIIQILICLISKTTGLLR